MYTIYAFMDKSLILCVERLRQFFCMWWRIVCIFNSGLTLYTFIRAKLKPCQREMQLYTYYATMCSKNKHFYITEKIYFYFLNTFLKRIIQQSIKETNSVV